MSIIEEIKNEGFQTAIARHTLGFCARQVAPVNTVFDRLPENNNIDKFLENDCRHTKGWFEVGRLREDAREYRKQLLKSFRDYINPLSPLVREIKDGNGGLFYAILPCGNVSGSWQQVFHDTIGARKFAVRFLYGVQKSSYVYAVFGLCAEGRLNISAAGVGKALGKIFTKRSELSSFISIVCLSSVNCRGGETWVALAIAHVACLRCACFGELDEFDPEKGDVGDSRAAFAVEYIRATSFPYALCGSLCGLTPVDAAKRKEDITAALKAKNLPLPWDKLEEGDVWTAKQKRTQCLSILFQVNTKTLQLLLAELDKFAADQRAKLKVSSVHDMDTIGVCVHAWLLFETMVEPNKQMLFYLINVAKRIGSCTVLSLAPIEPTRNNMLTAAILASFDSDPSPIRDDLLAKISPPPYPMAKPHPPPARKPPPPPPQCPVKRGATTAPQDPRLEQVEMVERAPKKMKKQEGSATRYKPATGYLLSQLMEVVFQNAPGTELYEQETEELVKRVHGWVLKIGDAEPDPIPLGEIENIARVTLGNAVLQCLQILSEHMYRCSKSIHYASVSFKHAVTEGLDTIAEIRDDFNRVHETCRGVEIVLNSFRFAAVDMSKDFAGIGVKRAAESCSVFVPIEPPKPILPDAIDRMNPFNLVKRIYMDILRAHDKLHEMCPDDGMLIDWDRICRNVGEFKDIAHEGAERCKALMDFVRMESLM